MMLLDAMPLHDVIDDFRRECGTAQVLDIHGARCKPEIDFDHCHALDFGYLFNTDSGKPETLTEDEALALKQPVIDHGISLAYPRMLLVERTCVQRRNLFITYVYGRNDATTMKYYIKDENIKHWVKVGHVENIHVADDGHMAMIVKEWGIGVPRDGMPQEDSNPVNHFVRMSLTLLAILMRRGDEVEQTYVARPHIAKPKGYQKKDVASVSIIKLNKIKLIKNVVDEEQSVVVDHTLRPHDRAGTISHRIKDMLCVHVWREEFRNNERWRNRCDKCDSCQFWRKQSKVHGGAGAITFHKMAVK
jgi:hypothetical protein